MLSKKISESKQKTKTKNKTRTKTKTTNKNKQTNKNKNKRKKGKRKKYTSGPRYWNVPVMMNTGTFLVYQYFLKNVIFTFFRTCCCYSEAYNTGMPKYCPILV